MLFKCLEARLEGKQLWLIASDIKHKSCLGFGFRVSGSGFRVRGLGFRVGGGLPKKAHPEYTLTHGVDFFRLAK